MGSTMTDLQNAQQRAGDRPALLFLNSHGDVDFVTTESTDDVHVSLVEKAGFGRPWFGICTLIDGVILDNDGNEIAATQLNGALEEAKAERVRFYQEHAVEYGETAWPY